MLDAATDMLEIRKMAIGDLQKYVDLHRDTYKTPRPKDQLLDIFRWKLSENPAGSAFGIVAERNGDIAAIYAGIPKEVPCFTVNKICASGIKSIALAAQAIKAGDGDIFVTGGTENMSSVPYYLPTAPIISRNVLVGLAGHDGHDSQHRDSLAGWHEDPA